MLLQTTRLQGYLQSFCMRLHDSWSRPRRVVAKAEQIQGKENPRYLVTPLRGGGLAGTAGLRTTLLRTR